MARAARGTPFRRNYKDEEWREPGEGYTGEEPVKGVYPMRLVSAANHTTEEGNESVHWQFECTDDAVGKTGDNYAGWRGHSYTNDTSTLWREQQILVALGAIKPGGSINSTLEEIVKKYGKVVVNGRVVRERYIPEDGEPEWKAKLTALMQNRDAPSTKRAARDEDDDEDDLEEDPPEEAAPPKRRARAAREAAPVQEPDDDVDTPAEGDEDEPYDPDELAEELEALSVVELKKRAREEFEFTTAELRGKTADEVIDMIIESLPEDEEEEEPEPEPEPPKRSRRTAAKTTTPARGRGKAAAIDDEPPF